MNLLSVDPGLSCIGVVVFDLNSNEVTEAHSFQHGPGEGDHPERVGLYYRDVESVFNRVQPLVLAIEDQQAPMRAGSKETTARFRDLKAVAQMVGRLWGLTEGTDCDIVFVNPRRAKKALSGSGNAKKDDMVRAAKQQYGLDARTKPQREAIADALGIALAAQGELRERALRESSQ